MPAVLGSEAMRQLMRMVARVAQTSAAVLITGESGSGKELVARALHHYSRRSAKAWVDVSCAALPEHLLESELFGYEKGAFSGAESTKPGLVEMAHTGTLFLDEIGELEPRMQVKLLRVLDGIPYYRLGGVRKISVDVRIVAATNQNLEEAIQSRKFRSDLYHRLSQIQLEVPPLRERPEDVTAIAEYFLRQHNPDRCFAPEVLEVLKRHCWPGNVRELRNVVTKCAAFAQDSEIGIADLPSEISTESGVSPQKPVVGLEAMERQAILRVLAQTNGHRQMAAELLGISRRTLSRKLKLYRMNDTQVNCMEKSL
jgi:DNA-binding NtrC family response regulator